VFCAALPCRDLRLRPQTFARRRNNNQSNPFTPLPPQKNKKVCEACEKKLTKVACPDPKKWKDGGGKDGAGESSGRKVNQNKLLNKDKRFTPYGSNAKCKICKQQVCLLRAFVLFWVVCVGGGCQRNHNQSFTHTSSALGTKNTPQQIHQGSGVYCHNCAYSKGLCAMCGKQILDSKKYKMTAK
jgi:hypothetical protein